MEFKTGGAIMAGDFNLCFDPRLDSTSWVQWTGNAQWKSLKRKLHLHRLIDVWSKTTRLYVPLHGTQKILENRPIPG